MILDDIRARYPAIGIAVFAMEPGQPVTVETYATGGRVFSFSGATADAALAKAFPEMLVLGETEVVTSAMEANVFD